MSKLAFSAPATATFVLALRINDVEVGTVTFDTGTVEWRPSLDALSLNIGDRLTVFVKSGIATRPAINLFYENPFQPKIVTNIPTQLQAWQTVTVLTVYGASSPADQPAT